MTKDTYTHSYKKKEVREFLFDLLLNKFKVEHIVGLPGPDINLYIEDFINKGMRDFEMYEYDRYVFASQVLNLKKNEKITLIHDDILSAIPDKKNTIYDLDFCGTIPTYKNHVKKFNENFIMTFAIRGVGIVNTIKEFCRIRKEFITHKYTLNDPIKHLVFETYPLLEMFDSPKSSKYIFAKYTDTSTMCCIAKIA